MNTMNNKPLSKYKIRKIISCFALDLTATQCSTLTCINRNTVNKYYNQFREKVFQYCLQEEASESGEFELDESYFGAKRVRGKRGRGAAGKTPVFGLLKRGDKVFVKIVSNCSRETLLPVIQGKILEGSTIYTDHWRAYNGLILNGYDHYRVFHSKNEFARGKNHINGIESFWSYAKNRLAKFNGLTDNNFAMHLKECQFRFNMRNKNMLDILLKVVTKQQNR